MKPKPILTFGLDHFDGAGHASTALNGFGLAIGFDQNLQPTIGVDYDLSGPKLYAGYDAADEGSKVGATLSF